MPTQEEKAKAPYYWWKAPGTTLSVKLDYEVIDRLHSDIMKGFGAVPKRGAEVGGLLLGTVEPAPNPVVVVHDYEPLSCEYSTGPSFVLSPHDIENLRQALARWGRNAGADALRVVGFYRSHTRDGFELADEDLELYDKYFLDQPQVILLVKPHALKPGTAGFFVPEGNLLDGSATPLAFPFRRLELGGGDAPRSSATRSAAHPPQRHAEERPGPGFLSQLPVPSWAREQAPPTPHQQATFSFPHATGPAPAAEPAQPDAARPRGIELPPLSIGTAGRDSGRTHAPTAPPPATPAGWKTRFAVIALHASVLLFGVVVGLQYQRVSSPLPSSAQADPLALGLAATRQQDDLLIRWDPQAPAVKQGVHGYLTISEGDKSKVVDLNQAAIRGGQVLYRHVAPEIRLKLEITLTSDRTLSESLTWKLP